MSINVFYLFRSLVPFMGEDEYDEMGQFTCTRCEVPVGRIHQLEKTGLMSLCRCGSCKEIADPYCEFSYILVLIDIILMRNGAVTHLLFNRSGRVRWIYLLLSYGAACLADSHISNSFTKSFTDITASVVILTAVISVIYKKNHPFIVLARVLCGTWYLLPLFLCGIWDYSQPTIPIPFVSFNIRCVYLPRFAVLVSWIKQFHLLKSDCRFITLLLLTSLAVLILTTRRNLNG